MLQGINYFSITVRILLSVIIGGALGFEREQKRHPAGFRTYILVCLGAALVMMTNQYVFETFHTGDVSRLGAQVISGIGFLGAGTIIITGRNQVRGLTTAAGLWASACIGLAIGIGFYAGAIVGGIAIFFVMTVLQRLDESMRVKSKRLDLYMEFDAPGGLGSLINIAKENNMEISNIQVIKNKATGKKATSVLLSVKTKQNQSHADVLQILECAAGLNFIEEL
ncbi:MAG: MgtC/SapB family protein [Selenomonadaceae bacterium]